MKIVYLFIFIGLFTSSAFSQFKDSFDDGDFSAEWIGDLHYFCVNKNQVLQLCADSSNKACLFTKSQIITNTEWEFQLTMAFSPSANNYLIVWLCADTVRDENISDGYYLRIGESGSNDAIELYCLHNREPSLIFRGVDKAVASPFTKTIRIEHLENKWYLFTKEKNSDYFIKEAETEFNDILIHARYFGLCCHFTASNSSNFYFDNFVVDSLHQDSSLPEISSIIFKNINAILVEFNKAISNGTNKYNYQLYNNLIYPESIEIINSSNSLFMLTFTNNIIEKKELLCINAIKDFRENCIKDTCINIVLRDIEYKDVVINEVMFDVNPHPPNLPNKKYIELFNTTSYPIYLSDWSLNTTSNIYNFSFDKNIVINDFLLITSDKTVFDTPNKVIEVKSFNIKSSDTISLVNNKDFVVDFVFYKPEMFFSSNKTDGGWSLELINPSIKNVSIDNWHECINEDGGSPLKINSCFGISVERGEKPHNNDIIINEILFNATNVTHDFIEIKNRSDKIISLRELNICVSRNGTEKSYPIGTENNLIYPNEIKLITSNSDGLSDTYPLHDEENYIISKHFPSSLNNANACIVLRNNDNEIIDMFEYNSDLHFEFLKELKGVSLERISSELSSQEVTNWQSAAESYNFASPGIENSHQFMTDKLKKKHSIVISNSIISPDNDGFEDIIEICCENPYNDAIANIMIYNTKGVLVRYLIKNKYLSYYDCFIWNGLNDDGYSLISGNYIIVAEIVEIHSKRKHRDKLVVSLIN